MEAVQSDLKENGSEGNEAGLEGECEDETHTDSPDKGAAGRKNSGAFRAFGI